MMIDDATTTEISVGHIAGVLGLSFRELADLLRREAARELSVATEMMGRSWAFPDTRIAKARHFSNLASACDQQRYAETDADG
jgi:hypothetical protein